MRYNQILKLMINLKIGKLASRKVGFSFAACLIEIIDSVKRGMEAGLRYSYLLNADNNNANR